MRFSPDSRFLLTAGQRDGFVRLIDVESGEVVRTFKNDPPSGTKRAIFTASGATFVSGSDDGTLRIVERRDGRGASRRSPELRQSSTTSRLPPTARPS